MSSSVGSKNHLTAALLLEIYEVCLYGVICTCNYNDMYM